MNVKTNIRLVTFYAAASILVLLSGSLYPVYDWDLIPYIASAKALESKDPVAIHSFTYHEIDKVAGTRIYASASSQIDSAFRTLMRTDYSAFSDQLAFYKVRVVYILCVYLMFSVGINPVFATHFISAISVFLVTWILFLIARRRFSVPLQFAILPMLLLLGAWDIARHCTPDALAFLLVLTIVYCFLADNPSLYILFPILVAVRTDLLILVVLLSLSLLLLKPSRKSITLLFLAISVGTFLLLNWYYSYPGWKALWYFTFVDKSTLSSPPEFGSDLFFLALFRGSVNAVKSLKFLAFLLIAGFAWFASMRQFKNRPMSEMVKSKSVILLIISISYVLIHMILFPLPDARFLLGSYVIATISLFQLMSSQPESSEDPAPTGLT